MVVCHSEAGKQHADIRELRKGPVSLRGGGSDFLGRHLVDADIGIRELAREVPEIGQLDEDVFKLVLDSQRELLRVAGPAGPFVESDRCRGRPVGWDCAKSWSQLCA